MTIEPSQDEIQTLQERAKEYYLTVKSEIESYQREDKTLIIGLDPKAKRFWVGETESEVLQKKANESNANLIYFIKLPSKSEGFSTKFLMSAV